MKKNKKKVFIYLSILLIIISLVISGYFIYIDYIGEAKYLKLKLNGDSKIIINYSEKYKDKGVRATYKNKDISKLVSVKNNLDLKHIGTYKYTYTIKYKKQTKKISRIVNVVDKEKPVIELNGKKEITLYIGNNYQEDGVKASDNYDGDLTEKVEIIGSVDTSKKGEYKITYSVKDSSLNETSIDRIIKVIEKPKPAEQKVAVLNYHFFYKNNGECNETICLNIEKFKEQMKYLNDNGFKTLTMKEFVSWMYGEIKVPTKSVLITIDDGAFGTGKHNGNYLIPVLEEYQIHATLFLITGWWDISNYSSPYLEVESHTHDLHIEENCGYRSKVNCVSYDKLLEDLKKSIEVTKSTTAFCFPFYESTNESIKAVKDAGFRVAFVGGNRKAGKSDNKYRIPRYPIYDSTTLEQFKKMVN